MTIAEIQRRALELPQDPRPRLAHVPLASLDEDEAWEREWMDECQRRLEDLDSGRVEAIPGEVVEAALRERLARK